MVRHFQSTYSCTNATILLHLLILFCIFCITSSVQILQNIDKIRHVTCPVLVIHVSLDSFSCIKLHELTCLYINMVDWDADALLR